MRELRILFDDSNLIHLIGDSPNGQKLCLTCESWGEASDILFSYEEIPTESYSDEELDDLLEQEQRYLEVLASRRADEADYYSMANSAW